MKIECKHMRVPIDNFLYKNYKLHKFLKKCLKSRGA